MLLQSFDGFIMKDWFLLSLVQVEQICSYYINLRTQLKRLWLL